MVAEVAGASILTEMVLEILLAILMQRGIGETFTNAQ